MANQGFGAIFRDIGQAFEGLFGGRDVDPQRAVWLEVLFGMLGYEAKIDSLITSHEADFINNMMDQLNLSMKERELASNALQRGRNRELDLKREFTRFRALFKPGSDESVKLYDALLQLAAADERLRPKELQFLEAATIELGYELAGLEGRLKQFKTVA